MPKYEGVRREPPMYHIHGGTLKISGRTIPGKAAGRAHALLRSREVDIIDFFLIGGNANQQAMKAMGLFRLYVEDEMNNVCTLAFTPLHVRTMADDPQGGPDQIAMDATVWRTVLLTDDQAEKVLTIEAPPETINPS